MSQSPKKRARSPRKNTGPPLTDQILQVMSGCSMSLPAMKQALKAGGYDVAKNNARFLRALKGLVGKKVLVQIKGTGASGSFRLNKKPPVPRRKKRALKKKPKVKRFRRATVTKVTVGDALAVTVARKKKKAKSPKRVRKPAAAKPKVPWSPKRVNSRVTVSVRTRSAAKK